VGAAASNDDALDWRLADAAGLAGAGVDAVFELEEASDAVGVDVVGDGGAPELDGVFEDVAEGVAETGELGAGEATGVPTRADAGAEECFVGVDIADAVEERLVEQGGLDGGLATAKEADEVFKGDLEGLFAWAGVAVSGGDLVGGEDGEAAEAAGVDEAELVAAREAEDGVRVRWDGDLGVGDEEAAGHAEMDEELGVFCGAVFAAGEIYDDCFADAVDALDAGADKGFDDAFGRGLEGLGFVAGPDFGDGLAMNAGVDAIGDGFDLGKFGHRGSIVAGGKGLFPGYSNGLNSGCTTLVGER
jgi:hypothetical protein